MSDRTSPELGEALVDLRQYLSDQVPPLTACNSLEVLLAQPPEVSARAIHSWVAGQYEGPHARVPISDYIFHAVKKIHLFGELKLIPEKPLASFLDGLTPLALAICPDEDREMLSANLARLGRTGAVLDAPVATIYRQAGSETPLASSHAVAAGPAAAAAVGEMSISLARFNRLLARVEKSTSPASAERNEAAPALLSAATTMSRDSAELEGLLKRLRSAGIDVSGKQLFRALSRRLPDWAAPAAPGEAGTAAHVPGSEIAGAMGRVIALAPDPAEALTRFREMVETAIEQVNEGSVARAATMLEVADRILDREKIDRAAVSAYRERAHAAIEPEALRAASERPDKRTPLRRVLSFFPRYRPAALLEALRAEKKRDRRRLWLALLEAHGNAAREQVLQQLEESLAKESPDWYYQRNLLYAARRIPRADQRFVEAEIGLFERLSAPGRPAPLVKEALANLGLIRHEKAEAVLVTRLRELEARALRPGVVESERDEALQVLDRAAAALARIATPGALRVLVDHALHAIPAGGTSAAWLAHLGAQDLSGEPELVEKLVKSLEADLPIRLFGWSPRSADPRVPHLVAALSGTAHPAAREALARVAQRFAGTDLGRLARRALEEPKAADSAPASLSGDLELFGLPTLLQTLEQSDATGVLVLRGPRGDVRGTLVLEEGKMRAARAGALRGADALYQLVERPAAGTFGFTRQGALRPEDGPLEDPKSLVPMLLEGMRRYDELQHAAALVPDDVPLRATSTKPTPDRRETDPLVLHAVWAKAAGGATAAQCEAAVKADSYRVRRMLAHWLEEGSLQPAEAAA